MPEVKPKARKALGSFVAITDELKRLSQAVALDGLILQILELTGYYDELKAEDPTDSEGRVSNVEEFVSVARQFMTENPEGGLAEFLTQMSLLSDLDSAESAENKFVLMTLHACKGLEYPVVFICGMEEGLLPHFRALSDKDQMEEERRLMYVGVTRAENKLFLTYARRRMFMGEFRYSQPSRFLKLAPAELLSGLYTLDTEASRGYDDDDDASNKNRLRQPGNRYNSGGNYSGGGGYQQRYNNPDSHLSPHIRAAKQAGLAGRKTSSTASSAAAVQEPVNIPKFDVGERVSHAKFGEGTVAQVIGEGAKTIYSVDFDTIPGKKLLDPKFAKLESI